MTPTDDIEHRAYHQPDPSAIEVREVDEAEDGTFTVRMPIASTGEVRNEGDEPLAREEISGMAQQINEGDVGVFLNHGFDTVISADRFSPTERLGSWSEAEVQGPDEERADDDTSLLVADAVMADPETLPAATGSYREALAILKEQAKRDIPLSSSIGWREDDDAPGGNDLMEVSIVGIPADPRTNSDQAAVIARAAVDAGADGQALVDAVRAAVMEADETDEQADDMTDDETDEESAEQSADDTTDDEQTERQDAPEWAEMLLENQQRTNDLLEDVADAIREDDEDDEDDEEDDDDQAGDDEDEDEDEDDEDNGNAQDVDDEIAELREAYDRLEAHGVDVSDVDLPDNLDADEDGEQQADDDDEHDDTTDDLLTPQ